MPAGYYIPETMENWKWPRHINPHHNEVHPEATAWIKSFITLSPKTLGAFDRCNFSASNYIYSDHAHILIDG
jgi:hypothetical protein